MNDINEKKDQTGRYPNPQNVKVGDGVTKCFYSDSHAYTVVKVTPKTISIQRDKATLLNKPEIIPGGFVGHCTNNHDLKYSYEQDPEGCIDVAHWSEKEKRFKTGGCSIINGRHEYYDYNF